MKQSLLDLIGQIDSIRAIGYQENSHYPSDFVLYNVGEFLEWRQKVKYELMTMPYQDKYIEETLKLINTRCTGLNDEVLFAELTGSLEAIKSNIDQYYKEDHMKKRGCEKAEFSTDKVFIVHGRDEMTRDKVELFLRRIGLNPVILCNEPNNGQTLIEKIESNTDVAFAVVLYTACDEGRLKTDTELKPRARQNVVFEHGYLINKLGRERVVALVESGVETPGDISGVIYISLQDADWKHQVMRELKNCSLKFDTTKA